jgi:O-phosphoseryl-tRNA(Cys) synthetase
MGINEGSVDPYLKRRMPELINAVIIAADWYMPSFMPDFQTYLDRAIYSGVISVIPTDYADTHVRQMEQLEDGLRNLINNDKELLEKFVSLYTRGAKKYVG